MATRMDTKLAVNSMSVSYEQFIHLQGSDGTSGAVQPKNTINADLRHYPRFLLLFHAAPEDLSASTGPGPADTPGAIGLYGRLARIAEVRPTTSAIAPLSAKVAPIANNPPRNSPFSFRKNPIMSGP
jgi:hypothetical protein